MIKRVRIENYKSFQSLSLELRPLSVIFGPNASGKSNFLDALYFLSRAVSQKNLKEAFEGHRGLPLESFYYGEEGYDGLLKKANLRFTIDSLLGGAEYAERIVDNIENLESLSRQNAGFKFFVENLRSILRSKMGNS